jgi:tRNA (guanine-N7-)-methyltransferase
MSFGLSRGKVLDVAAGVVGVTADELGPLPDEIMSDPEAGWIEPRAWFGDRAAQPLEIEIGSGKGSFLLQQAAREPDVNYLGIEWAGEFYAYTADRLRRSGLTNVRMLNADATEFLRWRCPSAIARVIHLYFSDPWPKRRHHKKRVVQDAFMADAHRVITPGGELRIVTDHDDYWAWMEDVFARWTGESEQGEPNESEAVHETRGSFKRLPFESPQSAGEGEIVGTNFERKYRREGRPFHACVLRKNG